MEDIQIAKNAKLVKISKIANKLNIQDDEIEYYGNYKTKINLNIFNRLETKANGKLILVTAITPTKFGEGKSTITIGLSQAFNKLGLNCIAAIRQPSMGPVFGVKGGATGGGFAQVLPMEDINLNFTGDFHAITAAHNLIAAAIDNHIWQGNELNIDINNIFFKRVLDTNDRALRNIIIKDKKYEREAQFQITVASELMAILCLSSSLTELKNKIGKIVIASNTKGELIRVSDLNVHGAATVILKDALKPNLVQTIENTPVLIHGGPFANIAHGCNSIIATKLALKLADYTITEAGFAADLGAEKFFNIKCRKANITPDAVVIVATVRALKENGFDNLKTHVENIKKFNLPIIVAINKFTDDTKEELEELQNFIESLNVNYSLVEAHSKGGEGAIQLADKLIDLINQNDMKSNEEITHFEYLYPLDMPLKEKINLLAKEIYRATDVNFSELALKKIEQFKDTNIDNMPICVSKTPMSITDKDNLKTIPESYTFDVKDIKLAEGAGFVIVMSGNIIDMPGLPKVPMATIIDIDENGEIIGLS